MIKKPAFYDFFNRRSSCNFDQFISESVEDEDYINWNDYVLPMHHGNAEFEYNALRHGCVQALTSPTSLFQIALTN